jgi:hypothetical protein
MTVRTRLSRACAALLLAATSGLVAAASGDVPWVVSRTASMTPASQPYVNEQYGFVVPAVEAARAYRDKPPSPNHGVILILGERRVIAVSAEHDAAQLGTARAYLDLLLHADEVPGHAAVRATRAAGHAAWSATVRQGDAVRKFIAVRRSDGGGINIALTLETTASANIEDSKTFEHLARELKFVALPR